MVCCCSTCLFVIQQVSLGLWMKQLGRNERDRERKQKYSLRQRVRKCQPIMPAAIYLLAKASPRQIQIQEVGNKTLSLHGTNYKVTVQSDWRREGWRSIANFIMYHTMGVPNRNWCVGRWNEGWDSASESNVSHKEDSDGIFKHFFFFFWGDFVILENIRKMSAREVLCGRNTSWAGVTVWTAAQTPHSFQPP